MKIAAVSDIDFPGSMEMFWSALQKTKQPDLLLFAGDMCDFGHYSQYKVVLDKIKKKGWKCPIYACFGNKEFEQDYAKIKEIARGVTFIEDEKVEFEIKGKSIGIVGSKGVLDMPTWWQAQNVMGIKDTYKMRRALMVKLMNELKSDIKILLTHYAPTYRTLKGEDASIWKVLGTNKLEKYMVKAGISFAIHGHAHFGTHLAFVGKIPVFNVALPISKQITMIDTEKLPKA
ncbi:MAG: metallophosphoesterase [Candidatus Aenigmatarchaeota archaeon]